MRYFAGVEDVMGIDWRPFKTRREAEAYAESVQGIIGVSDEDSDIVLQEINLAIGHAVEKYQAKKSKHISIIQG